MSDGLSTYQCLVAQLFDLSYGSDEIGAEARRSGFLLSESLLVIVELFLEAVTVVFGEAASWCAEAVEITSKLGKLSIVVAKAH